MPSNNIVYTLLVTLTSFIFSVIAAVLAIDMYRLLRTGEIGKTWRVLIIMSVMFALVQVLRLCELFNWTNLQPYHLSDIVELAFAISLAYTFYLQRQIFSLTARFRNTETDEDRPEPDARKRRKLWSRGNRWGRGKEYKEYYDQDEDGSEETPTHFSDDDDVEWETPSRHKPPPTSRSNHVT